MAPRVCVTSLQRIALTKIPHFFKELSEKVANEIVDNGALLRIDAIDYRREAINLYISDLRYIIGFGMPSSLFDEVAVQILQGIKMAADSKRSVFRPETDNVSRFAHEMLAIVSFCNVIATPRMRKLDLTNTVKMLRSHIFDNLASFKELRILLLGSGSGGVSDIYHEKFLLGLRRMHHLVHFSLTYDCTDEMLSVLSKNCARTLRILDVEYSIKVTDQSIPDILQCKDVQQLHIFHTGLSLPGKAQILINMKNLRILVRGDFLCDVLDYLDEELDIDLLPRLQLEEFWSSEEYFFHDTQQMDLVRQMCPKMRKIMFQFNAEVSGGDLFQVLSPFAYLTELHNWGGEFYNDKLHQLLEAIGDRMKTLYLIHVDQIDIAAISFISRSCNNLQTLGFYNCIVRELDIGDDHVSDHYISTEIAVKLVNSMPTVTRLAIVSEASNAYLVALITAATNVRFLATGNMTAINDDCFVAILQRNSLQKLEELRIAKSTGLTATMAYTLLHQCSSLRLIRMMEFWSSISKRELNAIRATIRAENYDVDTGENEEGWESIGRRSTSYWSRQNQALQAS